MLGRLVDRLGQSKVLLAALVGHTVGLGGLVALVLADAPAWTLFPAAVLAGGSYAQPGSLVRARWSHVLAGEPLLPTAFSWESVVDEIIFVLGPVLVTALATGIAPAAGLLTAYGFTLAGCLALALQRRTEPPAQPVATGTRGGSALLQPGVPVLVGVAFGLGSIFGSVEVATVAFTAERDRPAAAGVVLALLAGGSLLSGLWYGTVAWRAPAHRRFLLGVLLLAAATVPLPFATDVVLLAVLVFLGGFAISPALIAGFALLDLLVPMRVRTEGWPGSAPASGSGWRCPRRSPARWWTRSAGGPPSASPSPPAPSAPRWPCSAPVPSAAPPEHRGAVSRSARAPRRPRPGSRGSCSRSGSRAGR